MKASQSNRFGFSKLHQTLAPKPRRQSAGAIFEALEERKLMSGVNHLLNLAGTLPTITVAALPTNGTGNPANPLGLAYNPTTNLFQVLAKSSGVQLPDGIHPISSATQPTFKLNISVNTSGGLVGGVAGNDLEIDGTVTDGANVYTGVLLTAEIGPNDGTETSFGYFDEATSSDAFDFRFVPTGGQLMSQFGGKDVYVFLNADPTTSPQKFNDTTGNGFKTAFQAVPQGRLNTLPPSPNIATTPSGNIVIGSGNKLTDSATISNGVNPTGTVSFFLFAPGVTPNSTYSNSIYTDVVTVNGNGTYDTSTGTNPGGYLPGAVGTGYEWLAIYNGDLNNSPAIGVFGDEPENVIPNTPLISTTQQPDTAFVGDPIADMATVSGGDNPTGTVTFNLYNNPGGNGPALFTDTEALVGGTATSATYTVTDAGTDYWVATYNGDVNNNSVTSGLADEPVGVSVHTPPPLDINTTQQPTSATVGTSIADLATVTGGISPTGTVTFNLYDNPLGTGTPLFTDTESLISGVATSAGYIAAATGTDYWVATYNGDSQNSPVTSGTADEPVTVTSANPNINTTQQPSSATVGTSVADKATVSGGFNPTGTVTFNLYDNPNATGLPIFTDTEALAGGVATSAGYIATATGTDYWVATYNGDSNNSSVTSGTGDEPVTLTPTNPSIVTTQQPASATVGTSVADKATVSGLVNPSGTDTVTFNLYSSATVQNGSTLLFTDTELLAGGVATSAGYIATATGTDYWVATFNGDSNNSAVTSGTADEPVTITPANPLINTQQQPASATVGTSVADKATVTGGDSPTGTVTFNLYNNPSGTGTPLFTDTENLVGGVATSAGYTAISTGTDYWVATYNGDTNNSSVTSGTADEPVTVTPADPTIVTNPGGTVVIGSGVDLTDSATLSGGFNPTGTITFYLFLPGVTPNALDSNNVYSDTVTVSGDGTVTTAVGNHPGGFLPTVTGTYQLVAVYSGDSNNNPAIGAFGDEPVAVTQSTPSINTQQQPATATAGTLIADKATVTGGDSPTGTVTFNLYNNPSGTGTPLFTDTELLVAGSATSAGYVATAVGTDYWVATYNGDANDIAVTSGTGDEPVVITPATPAINTQQQPATAVVGSSVADKATVTGGFNPTGTVTFNLYNNPNATGSPLFTDTENLVGGVATSAGYTATAVGTDYWVATYNGDSNDSAVTSGTADEPVVITPATPAINTQQQPATAVVGSSVADKATVTGGYNPTGTVTFKLYTNATASGSPIFTDTETLVGGVATSAGYIATATGTDYWVATYNGDSNNVSVTSGKADEPVCITPAHPAISTTQLPATAVVGSTIKDKATVTGGYNLTGTVTFKLYNNATATGSPLFTDTETLVGGVATSAGYIATAAATDYWVATYNGDSNNVSVTSGKADEPVCITKASPAINTTQLPATAVVGSSIADKATVTGGYNPTGTVSFKLYNNATATGTPLFTDTETLVGGVATSAGYIAAATGTDYWVATYNGDSNNVTVTSGKADEPVCITPPTGTITGTKYSDLTGNGFSSDDTALGGVTINLYKDINGDGIYESATDTLYKTTVTASNGTYSFTGLPLGKYIVGETVPTGYVQTGPSVTVNSGDYAANLTTSSPTSASNNFDNFLLDCDLTDFSNIYYCINGTKTVTDLRGNTHEGDTVTVFFTVNPGVPPHQLTLVSYTAPDSFFNANDASQQQEFQVATGVFGPGQHSLTVEIPCSDYQIDFVCGAAIDMLGPAGSNIFYSAQQRLISADNGGFEGQCTNFACICGNVYNDLNCNGSFQSGDCGIGGTCITITGVDDCGNTCTFTRYTDSNGNYCFDGLRKGTYKVTETNPGGWDDKNDCAGTYGGTVTNDCVSNVKVTYGNTASGYNFGEVAPTSLDGFVYDDINNNGLIDRGEGGLANVTVTLTGTNDLNQAVSTTAKTDADGYYAFNNLRPGTYKLVESTPSGYTDGKDTVGSAAGNASVNDTFSSVVLNSGANGTNYNFGERKTTTTLTTGSTGSIAFWRNTQGQALIKALNGGSTATNLGNWLATNYPKMYGASAGIDNLAGKTNAQVAAFYLSQFNGGTNVEPSVMAAALSVYVTDSDLASTTATSYNFKVSTTGLGALTASVAAANGSAFGTSTSSSTTKTILQLLTATNGQAVNGSLYNGSSTLLAEAYSVYDTLNRSGDVIA